MRIYTDGSCRSEVGGWAWWCPHTNEWKNGSESGSTNQRMELYAALDAIKTHYNEPDLTIISDSQYLVNCFGERWWVRWLDNGWIGSNHKGISNRDIWEPLLQVVKSHGKVKFEWVKGHSGDVNNEKADTLAVIAATDLQKELAKLSSSDLVIPRDSMKIGNFNCVFCSNQAEKHFLSFVEMKFLSACQVHAGKLRAFLAVKGTFDEHFWGAKCNTAGTAWSFPIEKGTTSWCEENIDDGIC